MQIRDHYKTLGLPPSASREEIRKAYRRLALQFHPDKNNDDHYATAQFAAIKEAYETLTDDGKRHEYLQQRWYAQSTGKWQPSAIVTPVTILQQLLILERNLSTTDVHRINELKFIEQLQQLLNTDAIETINSFDDESINEKIIAITLKCCRYLHLASAESILVQLEKINIDAAASSITKFRRDQRGKENWEKRQVLLVLIAVAVICVLIYWVSRS